MIVFAEKKHIPDIAVLWNEAFGDSKEDVLKYLDTILKYCVVFEENGKALGMLFLLPVKCGSKNGRYVYAVATLKKCRGKGISTKLLDFAKSFICEKNEDFLILVPQSDSLFDFYEKRGFVSFSCIKKVTVDSFEGCDGNIVFEKLSPAQYYEKRKAFLRGRSFIEWDAEALSFAEKMYDGEFLLIKQNGREMGVLFAVGHGENVIVKELLSAEPKKSAKWLKTYYEADKISIVYPCENDEPSAMLYPKTFENAYFNIALD